MRNTEADIQEVVFALCEGSHDVAFLYRILKTIGFKNYSLKIEDFPDFAGSFIRLSLEEGNIDELKLDEIRQRPIPSKAIYKEQNLFLLYSVHGDSKKHVREKIIKRIIKFFPDDLNDDDELNALKKDNIKNVGILYFFDADAKGVDERLKEVKREIGEFSGKEIPEGCFSQNGCIETLNNINYGVYIFAEENGKGKLEDILLPLMEADSNNIKGNSEIFREAQAYLDKFKNDARLKKLKIQENDKGEITEKRTGKGMNFDELKSRIAVAGQLQNSGKSNVVIIEDCDYLELDKIRNSRECSEIINFFQKILAT